MIDYSFVMVFMVLLYHLALFGSLISTINNHGQTVSTAWVYRKYHVALKYDTKTLTPVTWRLGILHQRNPSFSVALCISISYC